METGRVAFVSGAGRGIGRAIAARLAAQGHAVAVGDVREESAVDAAAAIASEGGRAHPVAIDVTDSARVAKAIEETAAPSGPSTFS